MLQTSPIFTASFVIAISGITPNRVGEYLRIFFLIFILYKIVLTSAHTTFITATIFFFSSLSSRNLYPLYHFKYSQEPLEHVPSLKTCFYKIQKKKFPPVSGDIKNGFLFSSKFSPINLHL